MSLKRKNCSSHDYLNRAVKKPTTDNHSSYILSVSAPLQVNSNNLSVAPGLDGQVLVTSGSTVQWGNASFDAPSYGIISFNNLAIPNPSPKIGYNVLLPVDTWTLVTNSVSVHGQNGRAFKGTSDVTYNNNGLVINRTGTYRFICVLSLSNQNVNPTYNVAFAINTSNRAASTAKLNSQVMLNFNNVGAQQVTGTDEVVLEEIIDIIAGNEVSVYALAVNPFNQAYSLTMFTYSISCELLNPGYSHSGATPNNTPNTIVERDSKGSFSVQDVKIEGVLKNTSLSSGVVKSDPSGQFSSSLISNSDIASNAAIDNSKLAGNPTTLATANRIALRDGAGGCAFGGVLAASQIQASTSIQATGTSDSSSTTTGVLLSSGGCGIAKNLYCDQFYGVNQAFTEGWHSVAQTCTSGVNTIVLFDTLNSLKGITYNSGTFQVSQQGVYSISYTLTYTEAAVPTGVRYAWIAPYGNNQRLARVYRIPQSNEANQIISITGSCIFGFPVLGTFQVYFFHNQGADLSIGANVFTNRNYINVTRIS